MAELEAVQGRTATRIGHTFMETEPRHQCLIYDGSPSRQLPMLAAALQRKLKEGFRCIYLNSPPMVTGMRSYLARSMDVSMEVAKARLVFSSEFFTTNYGDFDVDLALHRIEDALNQALNDGYKGLWATGDLTWEFGYKRNFAKLMEYEWRLDKFFQKHPELNGICQYHCDTLPREAIRQGLLSHQTVFVSETLSRLNPHYVASGLANDQKATNSELDELISVLCDAQQTA